MRGLDADAAMRARAGRAHARTREGKTHHLSPHRRSAKIRARLAIASTRNVRVGQRGCRQRTGWPDNKRTRERRPRPPVIPVGLDPD